MMHPLLDRSLATAIVAYVLHGVLPSLDAALADQGARALAAFARAG
jgi:hypothetical protein